MISLYGTSSGTGHAILGGKLKTGTTDKAVVTIARPCPTDRATIEFNMFPQKCGQTLYTEIEIVLGVNCDDLDAMYEEDGAVFSHILDNMAVVRSDDTTCPSVYTTQYGDTCNEETGVQKIYKFYAIRDGWLYFNVVMPFYGWKLCVEINGFDVTIERWEIVDSAWTFVANHDFIGDMLGADCLDDPSIPRTPMAANYRVPLIADPDTPMRIRFRVEAQANPGDPIPCGIWYAGDDGYHDDANGRLNYIGFNRYVGPSTYPDPPTDFDLYGACSILTDE